MTISLRRLFARCSVASMAFHVIAACSTADPHPRAAEPGGLLPQPTGGSSSGSSGGEGGDEAAAVDATSEDAGTAADVDTTGLCNTSVPDIGLRVDEVANQGSAPQPTGGSLVPGVYGLINADAWGVAGVGDSGETGDEAKYAFVLKNAPGTVAAGTLLITGSKGKKGALPPATTTGYVYTTNGTKMTLMPACPTTGAAIVVDYALYGANAVQIFRDPSHRETYVR